MRRNDEHHPETIIIDDVMYAPVDDGVHPLKLSDCEDKEQFIKHVIKGSRRADIIREKATKEDVRILERLMWLVEGYAAGIEYKEMPDSMMSIWLYINHDGAAHIGASWGGYMFTEIDITHEGYGEWVEEIVTDEDEYKKYQKMVDDGEILIGGLA